MRVICVNDHVYSGRIKSYTHDKLHSIKKGKSYKVLEQYNFQSTRPEYMGLGLHYRILNEEKNERWYFNSRFVLVYLNSNIILL